MTFYEFGSVKNPGYTNECTIFFITHKIFGQMKRKTELSQKLHNLILPHFISLIFRQLLKHISGLNVSWTINILLTNIEPQYKITMFFPYVNNICYTLQFKLDRNTSKIEISNQTWAFLFSYWNIVGVGSLQFTAVWVWARKSFKNQAISK